MKLTLVGAIAIAGVIVLLLLLARSLHNQSQKNGSNRQN
jgi:hypothetical protein